MYCLKETGENVTNYGTCKYNKAYTVWNGFIYPNSLIFGSIWHVKTVNWNLNHWIDYSLSIAWHSIWKWDKTSLKEILPYDSYVFAFWKATVDKVTHWTQLFLIYGG